MSKFDFVFAVGDVHGRLDKLVALNAQMTSLAEQLPGRKLAVYLGDYVDRGPESAAVVAELRKQKDEGLQGFDQVKPLMGNHEELMYKAVNDEVNLSLRKKNAHYTDYAISEASWFLGLNEPDAWAKDVWIRNGGVQTVHSYYANSDGLERMVSDAAWMMELDFLHREGDFYFVHAGIEPSIPLERQLTKDLLWIRYSFLHSNEDFGVRVVHGHTPVEKPEIKKNRIGIDTGACWSGGHLTCAVIDMSQPVDQEPRILQS